MEGFLFLVSPSLLPLKECMNYYQLSLDAAHLLKVLNIVTLFFISPVSVMITFVTKKVLLYVRFVLFKLSEIE